MAFSLTDTLAAGCIAFAIGAGAALSIPGADPVPVIVAAEAGCLTDTDCDALADGRALRGLGCVAPKGEAAWWRADEPLYRDHEDEFPATCADIHPVTVEF
jgi:hypothetical protein